MPNGREAAIESYVPGRVRIRLPREQRDQITAGSIQSSVEEVKGVRNVFINPSTGSVLVEYDPGVLDFNQLKSESRLGRIIHDIDVAADVVSAADSWPGGPSVTAQGIIQGFRQFDRSLNRITRGVVDGKTAVPLMLLGLSLGRYFLSERRAATPWYSLLWYSYSMFMHWNSPNKGRPPMD